MEYRPLGRTGIQVSPFALGAMMFGALGNPDHEDSVKIVHRALDAGINLVDTADVYSGGESEEIVGKALQGRRDDVVLATKAGLPVGHDPRDPQARPRPNTSGASRRYLTRALEASLRRLRTDYVDVFQVHRPDPGTDLEETLAVLTDLQREGKIRAFGTSSMPASDIVRAQWVAERRGLARPRTEQPPYSILDRGIEREVLPALQEFGMGALVWSPMAGGLLTGRYRKGQAASTHRSRFGFRHLSDEARLAAVESLVGVADEAGIALRHLALAFVVAHPGVSAALIGPRTMEQLDDLLAGAETALDDDVLDRIDAIVPPGTDVGTLDQAYRTPALTASALRRRPVAERRAA